MSAVTGEAPRRHWAAAAGLLDRPAVRFVVAGAANTAFGFVLLRALLLGFASLPYPVALANGVAYAINIGISFAANRRWTFRSGGAARAELPRFVTAHLGALALSSALMQAGVSVAGLPLLTCFLLVLPVTTTLNFVVQRYWVFRPHAAERGSQ